MRPSRLSAVEELYIREGVAANVRGDGRSRTELRPVTLNVARSPYHVTATAHTHGAAASATIRASVIAAPEGDVAIHLHGSHAVEKQYAALLGGREHTATMAFTAHVAAVFESVYASAFIASAETEGGADGEWAATVTRCPVLRGDLALGGGYSYRLDVDVQLLQAHGGGIVTTASYAIRAGLASMRLPYATVTQGGVEVDYGRPALVAPRVHEMGVVVQMQLCGGMYVVDPTLEEEAAMPSTAVVGVTPSGRVSTVRWWTAPSRRGTATTPVSLADAQCLVAEAALHGEAALRLVDEALEAAD